MPELLTVQETAEYLRLSPSALYAQRHRGDTPGALSVRVGRKILWRRDDIDRWFDEQRARPATRRVVMSLGLNEATPRSGQTEGSESRPARRQSTV